MKPSYAHEAEIRPAQDFYELSDDQVREALREYLARNGADTTGTMAVFYPDRHSAGAADKPLCVRITRGRINP